MSWTCSEHQVLYILCMCNHTAQVIMKIFIFRVISFFSWATDISGKKISLKHYSLCSKIAIVHFRTELMIGFPELNSLFSNLVAKCLLLENACFPGIINHTLLGGNQLHSLFSHPF